ncbi:hypothetical protein [Niastella populi]|uniref:Uncharacterized protein n=1 Tax=Niastella populi TaxID=550983 RepID=A0A1V9EJI5_9BACT|nr:hypothetical protein [Niastella populi]OQP46212.1 hypothetical protein A4R26_32095 [Niastella populi]
MTTKYYPIEILQIIQANYKQQQQYDDIVLKDQELTFETTILEWRDICDLVDTSKLWKYLNYYFRMTADEEAWMNILEPEDEKTLGDLCNFIAILAEKEIIRPIKLFGNYCTTAAIFKSLKGRLKNRGIDVPDLKPSSQLAPLVKKYNSVFIEEINQIDPMVLPPINYKTNWVYKWGLRSFITFLFLTILLICIKSNWAWYKGGVFLIGYGMTWLGGILKPKQASFRDIHTVADLVRRIKVNNPHYNAV